MDVVALGVEEPAEGALGDLVAGVTVAGLYWLVSPIMYVSPVSRTASMIAAISSAVTAIGTAE